MTVSRISKCGQMSSSSGLESSGLIYHRKPMKKTSLVIRCGAWPPRGNGKEGQDTGILPVRHGVPWV